MSGFESVTIKGLGLIEKRQGELVFLEVGYHAYRLDRLRIPFEVKEGAIAIYRDKSSGINDFRRFIGGNKYIRLQSSFNEISTFKGTEKDIVDIVLASVEEGWDAILKKDCKGPMRKDAKIGYISDGFSPELFEEIGKRAYFYFKHATAVNLRDIGVVLSGMPGRKKSRLVANASDSPPSWHNYFNNNEM